MDRRGEEAEAEAEKETYKRIPLLQPQLSTQKHDNGLEAITPRNLEHVVLHDGRRADGFEADHDCGTSARQFVLASAACGVYESQGSAWLCGTEMIVAARTGDSWVLPHAAMLLCCSFMSPTSPRLQGDDGRMYSRAIRTLSIVPQLVMLQSPPRRLTHRQARRVKAPWC